MGKIHGRRSRQASRICSAACGQHRFATPSLCSVRCSISSSEFKLIKLSSELGHQREQQRQKDHGFIKSSLDDLQQKTEDNNAQNRKDYARILDGVALVQSSSKANRANLEDVRKTTNQVASAMSDLSEENRDWFRSVMYTNLKNYDAILAVQQSISSVPTTMTDSNIKFTDALDRHHELPYSYFQVWDVSIRPQIIAIASLISLQVFEAFLKAQFVDVPGSSQVSKGQYHILDGRDSLQLVTKTNWSQGVFPGSEVTMAVVLSMVRIEEGRCPRPSCGWRIAFSKLTTVITWYVSYFLLFA